MSMVKREEALLKMESKSDMRAAIMTAIIKPRSPKTKFHGVVTNTDRVWVAALSSVAVPSQSNG